MPLLKDFRYESPGTVAEALKLRMKVDNSVFLAGGTFVLNHLKKSAKGPEVVISLKKIAGLSGIKKTKKELVIGATTTIADLLEDQTVRQEFPALFSACLRLGTTPIRHMATIGGNVASRFYWVDLPAVLMALDAQVVVVALGSKKTMMLEEFLCQKRNSKSLLSAIVLSRRNNHSLYLRHTRAMDVDVPFLAAAFSWSWEKSKLKDVVMVINTTSSFPAKLKTTPALCEGRELKGIVKDRVLEAFDQEPELVKLDDERRSVLRLDLENFLENLKDEKR